MVRMTIPKTCLYGERCLDGECAYTMKVPIRWKVTKRQMYLYDEHDVGAGIHVLISHLVCAWVFLDMFRSNACPLDVFVIGGSNSI